MLSSREQNNILYNHCPTASHDLVRMSKRKLLQKFNGIIVNKKKSAGPRSGDSSILSSSMAADGSTPSPATTSLPSHSSSSPHTGSGGAASPPTSSHIPDDIKKISEYMEYFANKGLSVKFNELLTYLDKTQQLNDQGGSELAQQMTTQQLLAVIKPNESLLPAPSPSTSSSKASPSLTSPPTPK